MTLKLRLKRHAECVLKWPRKIPDEVKLKSAHDYYLGSQWMIPLTCAVCAQQSEGVDIHSFNVSPDTYSTLHLDLLVVKQDFTVQGCELDCCNNKFEYVVDILKNHLLTKEGIDLNGLESVPQIQLCQFCHSDLQQNRLPKYALANDLYRGILPAEFDDLTWVEEMVCSLYRNTAHVTRLYQSTDPKQPKVFHGNTCAHEMNTTSTASVLPRSPSDVNDLLSVVFIGPGKFSVNMMGPQYRIRKMKVWRFLIWLSHHNILYRHVLLDEKIMQLYPEDGMLPGIEDRLIHDKTSDPKLLFDEETTGFSDHPAQSLEGDSSAEDPVVLLEKMGVSDPDGARIQGHTYTAAALRNLYPHSSDMILHHGHGAVPEYNNPNLMPGMFPTLYPLGIGGFEVENRLRSINFQQQAEYYLNLHDRSFRYHFSFIFVTLNIHQ